jgi:hypothetical protein
MFGSWEKIFPRLTPEGVLKSKRIKSLHQGNFQSENAWILSQTLGDSISTRTFQDRGDKVCQVST